MEALLIRSKDSGFLCPPKKKCITNQLLGLNEQNGGRQEREEGDINNVLFYWNQVY